MDNLALTEILAGVAALLSIVLTGAIISFRAGKKSSSAIKKS